MGKSRLAIYPYLFIASRGPEAISAKKNYYNTVTESGVGIGEGSRRKGRVFPRVRLGRGGMISRALAGGDAISTIYIIHYLSCNGL